MKRLLSKDEEKEVAIAYLGGIPIKDICECYDVGRMTVHRVLKRLGIETERGKRAAK